MRIPSGAGTTLGRQLATYMKQDLPPTQVSPIRISAFQALDVACQGGMESQQEISDLACITILFLLRPLEYCRVGANTNHRPFLLRDLQFFIGQQPFNAASAIPSTQARADFSASFSPEKWCQGRFNQPRHNGPPPRLFDGSTASLRFIYLMPRRHWHNSYHSRAPQRQVGPDL